MELDGTLEAAVEAEGVAFTFTVTNTGTEPVDLTFRSGKHADVAVEAGDTEVWRWSDDRMFMQALGTETLAPDETLTEEMTWEEPPAGEYTAEATLDATDHAASARAAFEVR